MAPINGIPIYNIVKRSPEEPPTSSSNVTVIHATDREKTIYLSLFVVVALLLFFGITYLSWKKVKRALQKMVLEGVKDVVAERKGKASADVSG